MVTINNVEIADMARTKFKLIANKTINNLNHQIRSLEKSHGKSTQAVHGIGQFWIDAANLTTKSTEETVDQCLKYLSKISEPMQPSQHASFWEAASAVLAEELKAFVRFQASALTMRSGTATSRNHTQSIVNTVLNQSTSNLLAHTGLAIRNIQQEHQLAQKQTQNTDAIFMRQTLDEARKCKPEDSTTPKPPVAAMAVRDGKEIARAYRGELRAGDHAEFTLLEGKLQNANLAGATLYVTLEPCTTRNHPKTPCAVRVIERRIARVVIAALDPNRNILGQGFLALQEAGIELALAGKAEMDIAAELLRDFTRHHRRVHT
ncbi:hypothetical protein D7Y27_22530 [Corallococcus sp. AB004]|nr:hypothetical protein D7Y27_22530 [Corallococcus sp. AB004]